MDKLMRLDLTKASAFVAESEMEKMEVQVAAAKELLVSGKGPGNDFLGWVDLPVNYDKEEFQRIQEAAERIRKDSDILVVIGIGGSYLGARAAIDFLHGAFYNAKDGKVRGFDKQSAPEIYFCGNSISASYLADLLDLLEGRDFSVNVISKSGTTTEPAIAFRILKEKLFAKYGEEEGARRIYATTDRERGALKKEAVSRGYETFVVPDDIGGRYSVLTAVGLLPIAVSGADIGALMRGAERMREKALQLPYSENGPMRYAAARNILHRKGKSVEILANYEPALVNITEWWKQLYGESEGKDHKGIFPAGVNFTTDLHSIGQFVQDGSRILFETVLHVEHSARSLPIGEEEGDPDGLNYLAGKTVEYVNEQAMNGTVLAHTDGLCPNLMLHVPERDEESLGALFYFFEFACGISGYLLGVNPFDQPGVESYKKNMFALLGKAGYEELAQSLKKRL